MHTKADMTYESVYTRCKEKQKMIFPQRWYSHFTKFTFCKVDRKKGKERFGRRTYPQKLLKIEVLR